MTHFLRLLLNFTPHATLEKNTELKTRLLNREDASKAGGTSLITSVFKRKKSSAPGNGTTTATAPAAATPALDAKAAKALHDRAEAAEAEASRLRQTVKNMEAEIALHKETKDELARSLKAQQLDMEDQRRLFKASMAELSERNKDLLAQLRLARTVVPSGATKASQPSTSESPTQGQTSAPTSSPAHETAAQAAQPTETPGAAAAADATTTSEKPVEPETSETTTAGSRENAPAEGHDELETLRAAVREATEARDILQAQLRRHEEALKHEVSDTEGLRDQLRHLNGTIATHQDELQKVKVRRELFTLSRM